MPEINYVAYFSFVFVFACLLTICTIMLVIVKRIALLVARITSDLPGWSLFRVNTTKETVWSSCRNDVAIMLVKGVARNRFALFKPRVKYTHAALVEPFCGNGVFYKKETPLCQHNINPFYKPCFEADKHQNRNGLVITCPECATCISGIKSQRIRLPFARNKYSHTLIR